MIYIDNGKIIAKTTELVDIENMKEIILPEIEAEIKAGYGISAYDELKKCVALSRHAITIFIDNKPLCVFGVIDYYLEEGKGLVYSFTSNLVYNNQKTFFKVARFFINFFATLYPVLFNYIDYNYKQSIEFFKRLGCKISDPVEFGPNKNLAVLAEYRGGN